MPQSNDHLSNLRNSIEDLSNDPFYQKWEDGFVSKLKRTEDYKDAVLEKESIDFLMDHNLFYWKMDRYMLRAEEIPSHDKIAKDRYLAHNARQRLLEIWKKKDSRVL